MWGGERAIIFSSKIRQGGFADFAVELSLGRARIVKQMAVPGMQFMCRARLGFTLHPY
jgi:hypothetical protein